MNTQEQGRAEGAHQGDPVEQSTEQAWRVFRAEVAEVLSTSDDAQAVIPGPEMVGDDEVEDVPKLLLHPEESTIAITAPINAWMGERWQQSTAQMRAIRGLGMRRRSSSGPYEVEVPRRHVDQAADLCVRYFRDVLGVVHPSFLMRTGALPRTGQGDDVAWQHEFDQLLAGAAEALQLPLQGHLGSFFLAVDEPRLWISPDAEGVVTLRGYVESGHLKRKRLLELANRATAQFRMVRAWVDSDGDLNVAVEVPWAGLTHELVCQLIRQAMGVLLDLGRQVQQSC